MSVKAQFLDYTQQAKQIITPINIADNGLDHLSEQIKTAELIVPVVGGFSAGKSTLINSFLGNEILPTAVTPETALATELRYSTNNYIEAITSNGTVERHELSEFSALKDNARNFKYLKLYLNNEHLKAIQPLVLVDMPGFDAPIENHNQAILSYLSRGVYFVFLTSVEDGNITSSMKREIDNLQLFGKGFSFCISKTNLRPQEDIRAVQEKVAEQLEDYFDYSGEVVLLDDNGGANLNRILQAIDPEKLFSDLFLDSLKDNYLALGQSINVKISTLKSTKQEAENTIQVLQQGIDEIVNQKNNAISDIERRYTNSGIDTIVNQIASTLHNQKYRLVDLAMSNTDSFSREINELVTNSLLSSVKARFQDISSDIVRDFSSGLKTSLHGTEKFHLGDDFISRIGDASHKLITRSQEGLNNLATSMRDKVQNEDKNQVRSMYKAMATIVGLTTSVVNPLVEVVIIFLPDIISFFTKNAKEKKMREQIEQQLVTIIIPDIQAKIRDNLSEIFQTGVHSLINQISQQFEIQLEQKQAEIAKATEEKLQKANDLENVLNELESANKALTQLANQYLFS